MYKKRGISPLITTVLLLGLVISLVTIFIIWNQKNVRIIIGKAERSQMKLSCTTDVDFDILGACYTSINGYKAIRIQVRNNNDKPINAGFMVKIIGEDTNINPSSPITILEANAVETFTVPHNVENIQKISVMPKIRSEGLNPVLCSDKTINLNMEKIEGC